MGKGFSLWAGEARMEGNELNEVKREVTVEMR